MSRRASFSTDAIVAALEKTHGGVYLAADELRCDRRTIERRAQSEPKVQAVIDKYRGRRSDIAQLKLEAGIMAGEPWAILFQLRTQGKDRGFVERQEVTGAEGGPVVSEVVHIYVPDNGREPHGD